MVGLGKMRCLRDNAPDSAWEKVSNPKTTGEFATLLETKCVSCPPHTTRAVFHPRGWKSTIAV